MKKKRKAFKDLKAGSLVEEVKQSHFLNPGELRIMICYAENYTLNLKGKIAKNLDLVDLAELSEEESPE